uniref:Uncharacterized protein n=1 Tax=Acrobeloides nanus TaxID=290746 RepID=A0A914D4V0_9BILA
MKSTPVIAYSFVGILFLVAELSHALTCYEDDPERGVIKVSDDNFEYCLLFPRLPFDHKGAKRQSGVSGMEYGSDDTPFSSILGVTRPNYKVLSLCIYEMYDWPRALHSSPKFGVAPKPDFMLRCVCNFDLCNVPTTFEPYLEGLKKHELANEKE